MTFPLQPDACPHEMPLFAGGAGTLVAVCKQCGTRWINDDIPDPVRAIHNNMMMLMPPSEDTES